MATYTVTSAETPGVVRQDRSTQMLPVVGKERQSSLVTLLRTLPVRSFS